MFNCYWFSFYLFSWELRLQADWVGHGEHATFLTLVLTSTWCRHKQVTPHIPINALWIATIAQVSRVQ